MEDFINMVNRSWEQSDPVAIAAFVLWRLNFIHPFVNGNGRTARAACYFVLCLKVGGWLPGSVILPELIRQERPKYVEALRAADETFNKGQLDITKLHELLSELLKKQVGG
jgi:Fic family protein